MFENIEGGRTRDPVFLMFLLKNRSRSFEGFNGYVKNIVSEQRCFVVYSFWNLWVLIFKPEGGDIRIETVKLFSGGEGNFTSSC